MQKIVSLIILCLIYSHTIDAKPLRENDDQTIYWQTYHRPPGIIKTGVDQGSGFVEKALYLITRQMPEYTHEYPIASLTRALADIKAKKNVCHPALFKTKERAQYMLFSEASMINPGNRIIALKGALDHLATDNYVDLEQLLESHHYSFSLIKERSYGQAVDDKIKGHEDDSKSQLLASTELGAIFHMVLKKRVDFTISFPFELNYFIEKNNMSPTAFSSYYIKNVPQYTLGYVACPKNAWGEQIIAKVNKVLNKTKLQDSYKQAVTSWWGNEQFSKEFEAFYNNQFLNH